MQSSPLLLRFGIQRDLMHQKSTIEKTCNTSRVCSLPIYDTYVRTAVPTTYYNTSINTAVESIVCMNRFLVGAYCYPSYFM